MTQPKSRRFIMEDRLDAEVAQINNALDTKITHGTVVNSDVATGANIAPTKISGTAVTQADTGTVTSTMIANGTIVDADVNASAAIAKTKISGTAVTLADTGTVTGTMIADNTITSVDLATLDYIKFNTAYAGGSTQPGMLNWNDTDGTLEFQLKGGNVTLQIGQEQVIRVKNNTGGVLSNGKAVYISGSDGINLRVAYANAGSELTSAGTIGILTEDLNNGNAGYITTFGLVRGIDTSTLVEGSPVWLSTTDGVLTATRPAAPNHGVMLGFCLNKHAVNGVVFVRVDNGWELDELHNVSITNPVNGQALTYDNATQMWKNATPISALSGLSDVTITSPVSGEKLVYNGTKWVNLASAGSAFTVSDVAPSLTTASEGDAWVNSSNGTMAVCYVDPDGTKLWLQVQANSALEASILARLGQLESSAIALGTYSPNYIINGAFDIWQRGTTITPSSGFGYGPDRWRAYSYGSSSTTMSQQAFTPGSAPVAGYEGTYFMRAISTNNRLYFDQPIEDVRTLAGKTITVSFWMKSGANQTITINGFQNFGGGGSADVYTTEQSISITTSWTRYSKTIVVPSVAGKTIGNGSYIAISFMAPLLNTNVDIWGVQVEQGSTATSFRRNAPSIQAELAACQRYYQKSYIQTHVPGTNSDLGSMQFAGSTNGGGNTTTPVPFRVEMRTSPSISFWALNGTANVWDYERSGASGQLTANTSGVGTGSFRAYVGTGVGFVSCATYGHWTANAEL